MSERPYARILVTSALPYANGPLHVGHLAGAYLPADVFCRYQRLCGEDIVFICGSDEHGVPIMLRARKEGVSPQVVVDRYHELIAKAFEGIGISFDHYGRTSDPLHHETSQAFFNTLAEKNAFVLKTEEQLYDPEAKLFLADRFVVGTCPSCGFDGAFGDQCEKCGTALSPRELKNPRSAITNASPELRKTTHWYLPLGDHQESLQTWIDSKTEWKTNVLGQVRSWLTEGLGNRAVTRDLPWGVPVPSKTATKANTDVDGKVLYVWFDAPIGYISATRRWAEKSGKPDAWKDYWQQSDTRLLHFIGKDNIVFHTLMFPAMLKAHGDYVLPENVPANEFLNLEGDKVSTSRGWAVWIHEALEVFPPDYLRYGLLRILPEAKDADFKWEEFQAHINNELADNLGNFVNRALTFAERYFDGKVPPLDNPDEASTELLAKLEAAPQTIGQLIDTHRLREAVRELMALSRAGNKYFNDAEPWASRKTDIGRCGNTIHVSLQLCAALSILTEPFLPFTAQTMRRMLALNNVRGSMPNRGQGEIGWHEAAKPLLKAGQVLGKPEILVRKIDDATIKTQLERLAASAAENKASAEYTPVAETIEFDDFLKLDLRVGRVEVAERVKKSKKLIRCEVDLGFERRQVLAGVAEHMSAEELLGSNVIVVANLKPRKMMGLMSHGMLLMAKNRDGKLVPVQADGEPGATVS